jgi:hypothetical protein
MMTLETRIASQFSGGALPCEARRERMKWSARDVAATPFDGPLQLLVRRLAQRSSASTKAIGIRLHQ